MMKTFQSSSERHNMSEEIQTPETPSPKQEEVKQDPFESRALEMGWRPKEEWDGPEEEFIDAKEFVRRQPLFEKIESQSKAIKQLSQAFDALKTHHTRVKEVEYQRALKSLKDAKKQALIDGETERALAYEEKIEEVEQQKAEFDAEAEQVQVPQTAEAAPEFVAWKQKNPWYNRDADLREFADTLGLTLARKGMPPAQVLVEVSNRVRKHFPEKFTNPNRDKPSAVEAPTRKGNTNNTFALTEEERSVMKKLVHSGAFGPDKSKAEAKYIEELKKIKGL